MQLETNTNVLSISQILQKQINEFLYPDKQDRLKKGCQIIGKYNGLITLSKNADRVEQSEFYHCYGFDLEAGHPRGVKGNELIEVLGKPIEFTDLCLFISRLKNNRIHLSYYSNIFDRIDFTVEKSDRFSKTLKWHCTKDFHNQEEAVFSLLNRLIEINNSNL
jgi:hypothetical protein